MYCIADNQSGSPKNWSFPEPLFSSSMRRKKLAGSGNEIEEPIIGLIIIDRFHNIQASKSLASIILKGCIAKKMAIKFWMGTGAGAGGIMYSKDASQ